MSKQKGTSKSNGRKDTYDRFYTNQDEAYELVCYMLKKHPEYLDDDYLLVEPSAGTGSFVKALESAGIKNILAYDLVPANIKVCNTSIAKHDFMTISSKDLALHEHLYDKEHIIFIGNPPFGVQGNLSIAFVNHCLELGNAVWFILPPTFKKMSYLKKIPHGIIQDNHEVENDCYTLPDASTRTVPSSFIEFIYVKTKPKQPSLHDYEEKLPFSFCKKSEADFSIRRVGGNAGKASLKTDVSEQSNYFMRLKTHDADDAENIIQKINQTSFPSRDWSVGPRSISKLELIQELSEAFKTANG